MEGGEEGGYNHGEIGYFGERDRRNCLMNLCEEEKRNEIRSNGKGLKDTDH